MGKSKEIFDEKYIKALPTDSSIQKKVEKKQEIEEEKSDSEPVKYIISKPTRKVIKAKIVHD